MYAATFHLIFIHEGVMERRHRPPRPNSTHATPNESSLLLLDSAHDPHRLRREKRGVQPADTDTLTPLLLLPIDAGHAQERGAAAPLLLLNCG